MKRLSLALCFLFACGDDDGASDASSADVGADAREQDTGSLGRRDSGRDSGSVDAGEDVGALDAGSDAGAPDSGEARMPVVVAYGWQGLRSLSIDEGQTWCETGLMEDPHDDLFRSGSFADGLFVGAHAGQANRGAIIVSRNGYEWTALHRTNFEAELPENPSGQWVGGVAFGNGVWHAAGGCGQMAQSTDGLDWTRVDRFVDSCLHIRSLAFGDGRFMAGLDDDTWWESADGVEWSVFATDASSQLVWNGSAFEGEVDGSLRWRGRGLCMWGQGWEDNAVIMRSENDDCSGAVMVAEPAHSVTAIAYGDAPVEDFDPDRLPSDLRDCLDL